jgi:hypothetical protein
MFHNTESGPMEYHRVVRCCVQNHKVSHGYSFDEGGISSINTPSSLRITNRSNCWNLAESYRFPIDRIEAKPGCLVSQYDVDTNNQNDSQEIR